MSEQIQRYDFVASVGGFASMEKMPATGQFVTYADAERDKAAAVAQAVQEERERWMDAEGGRLLDAARRVGQVHGKDCITTCKCDHCSTLRELSDAYDAAVRSIQAQKPVDKPVGCDHDWVDRTDGYEEQCGAAICTKCGKYGCDCTAGWGKMTPEQHDDFMERGIPGNDHEIEKRLAVQNPVEQKNQSPKAEIAQLRDTVRTLTDDNDRQAAEVAKILNPKQETPKCKTSRF